MGTTATLLLGISLLGTMWGHVKAVQVPLRNEWPAFSNLLKPVINENIQLFVSDVMQNKSMKGLSMAVIRSDGEVEFGSWGNSTEYGDKVTPETLFGLASSSQIFDAAAWAILSDDFHYGRNKTPLPPGVTTLNSGTRINDWFPDMLNCSRRTGRATTSRSKDILCAPWSFLPNLNFMDSYSHNEIPPYSKQDDILDIIRRSDLGGMSPFRFSRVHNDILRMATHHVIAKYSGMQFTTFVQERLFNDLDLTSTTYSLTKAEESGMLSHSWTLEGRRIPFYNPEDMHQSQIGVHGVISNAVDMAKWLKFLWSDGTDSSTNATLISDTSYHLVTLPRTIFSYGNGTIGKYTKAWKEYDNIQVIFHSGNLPGASSLVAFYPKGAFGIVLLANTESPQELRSIFDHVIEQTFDLDPPDADMRIKFSFQSQNAEATFPGNITPELPLEYYQGTYSNPGYGTFQLCSTESRLTDRYCADVLESFRIVDNTTTQSISNAPQLLASWPRRGSTHLRLVHRSGNTFSSFANTLFVNGYGMDKSPFQMNGTGEFSSVFAVEDGFVVGLAMVNCFQTNRGEKMMNEWRNSTTDSIIAWFDKVA